MSCDFTLDHYRELLDAARAGGYRFAHFDRRARGRGICCSATTSTSRSTPRCGWPSSRRSAGASATYFLMTESVFYNLASSEGVAARSSASASSAIGSASTPSIRTPGSTSASTRSSPGTTPIPST